jgi:hypothetical protein
VNNEGKYGFGFFGFQSLQSLHWICVELGGLCIHPDPDIIAESKKLVRKKIGKCTRRTARGILKKKIVKLKKKYV